MSELRLEFAWEAPGAARGPELRATWARLLIAVDGQVVTRVAEQPGDGIRDAIYVPLYPLAEWIVANWWALLFEFASPERIAANGFAHRHNLASAAEGFALPRLSIRPEGSHVLLVWNAANLPRARLTFLAQGSAYVVRDDLETTLRDLVNAVVNRLDDQGVPDTPLAEDWAAVCGTVDEERAFCRAAALLGWDPYALGTRDANAVIEVARQVPPSLLAEFLGVTDPAKLMQHATLLGLLLQKAQHTTFRLTSLKRLRERPIPVRAQRTPWEQGYELARHFRERIGVNGAHVHTVEHLGEMMKLDPAIWRRATRPRPEGVDFVSGLVAVNQHGTPSFVVEDRNKPARTFAVCRALCEYLAAPTETAALVTTAYSERQKRNRAFAAELVAPAELLRKRIRSSTLVPAETIQEIATDLGTSEFVIRHQIENHPLARVADAWDSASE